MVVFMTTIHRANLAEKNFTRPTVLFIRNNLSQKIYTLSSFVFKLHNLLESLCFNTSCLKDAVAICKVGRINFFLDLITDSHGVKTHQKA